MFISVIRFAFFNARLFLSTVQIYVTQRRTRVLGYHSQSAQTRSSMSLNGLELGLKLELERELERAARQTKNDNKGAYCYT